MMLFTTLNNSPSTQAVCTHIPPILSYFLWQFQLRYGKIQWHTVSQHHTDSSLMISCLESLIVISEAMSHKRHSLLMAPQMYLIQRSCRQDTVSTAVAVLPTDITDLFGFCKLYKDNKSWCFTVGAMFKSKKKLCQLKLIVSLKTKKAKLYSLIHPGLAWYFSIYII